MSRRNLIILSVVLTGLVIAAGVRIRQLQGDLQRTRSTLQTTQQQLDALQRDRLVEVGRQLVAGGSSQASKAASGRRGAARSPAGARGASPKQDAEQDDGSPRATRRAAVRERLQQAGAALPDDFFLDKLFDVVDELASDEGWSDATYDEVAITFETTADNLKSIAADVQAGQLDRTGAREELLNERDALLDDLDAHIGPEGTRALRASLKQHIAERVAARKDRAQP